MRRVWCKLTTASQACKHGVGHSSGLAYNTEYTAAENIAAAYHNGCWAQRRVIRVHFLGGCGRAKAPLPVLFAAPVAFTAKMWQHGL